jgi:hypothetical protein
MPFRLVECEHLGEAMQRLRDEHQPQRWVYRGQSRRRPVHRLRAEGQELELENLYPQAFRFAADYPTVSPEFLDRAAREEAKAGALFHAFNGFLLSKYESGHRSDSARFAWLEPYADELRRLYDGAGPSVFSGFHEAGIGLNNPEFIRLSWSLAQHYGVVTALLDLTWDPDVAGWFATNPWDAPKEPHAFTGHGIIYRFDVQNLLAATAFFNLSLKSQSRASLYEAPEDKAFCQSLAGIPPEFALRPVRQQALALSGFDALRFHSQFRAAGQLEGFLFPHLPDQLSRWPCKHAREFLRPEDDPFLDLKIEFDQRWAPHAESTYGVKLSIPVVILTDKGPRYANVPDEEKDARLTQERKQLYESGMAALGADLDAAEKRFQSIVSGGHGAQGKFSSLAHLRLALLRLQTNDLAGMVEALQSSLDGAARYPDRDWVGELLQNIAQGAQLLVRNGEGNRVLGLLGRLIEVAAKADRAGLALEAGLGAGVLKAQVELAAGLTQAGIDTLAKVVKHPVAGLKPAERAHSATAADMMAQVYEALGDAQTAKAIYATILKAFSPDRDPSIMPILERARRKA